MRIRQKNATCWHTEANSYERSWEIVHTKVEELERTLGHVRTILTHKRKELEAERNEKHALEMRIMKALHPEEENAEDSCQEEADNSPSPSFGDAPELHDESDPAYQGGNDGNPEGFF